MLHRFDVNGHAQHCWLVARDCGLVLLHGGVEYQVALSGDLGRGQALSVNGAEEIVHIARDGDRIFLHIAGQNMEIFYRDAVALYGDVTAGAGGGFARAPMPGTVLSVAVEAGHAVKAGETLLLIESMKLEMAIKAPRAGIVKEVHVKAGQNFDRDALLVTLAPISDGEG